MMSTCSKIGASLHTLLQLFWLKASKHLSPPDTISSFLAISSSVRSNTFNAVALSLRDSPEEIVTDRTPQGALSMAFLSTKPFKFLSKLSVPATSIFVPRSAQLSSDLTNCLERECLCFDHLL